MSKNILITFSGKSYDRTTGATCYKAPKLGNLQKENIHVYDDKGLMTQSFYQEQKWAWEHPGKKNPDGTRTKMGFGWYIWKPFVILDAINKANEEDVVFFIDGDTYPVLPFGTLFDLCQKENGIYLFEETGITNRKWIKEDCFQLVAPEVSRDSVHATCRFILFQKGGKYTLPFLEEWLKHCCDQRCMTYDPSVLYPEHKGFIEHRNEQAIFGLLAHKYGIPLHRACDAAGEGSKLDRDKYGCMFKQEYCHGNRYDYSGSSHRTEWL